MNYFQDGIWTHTVPNKGYNASGRRGIINHLCFGPLETITYGITIDSKCYYEYHIIEGIQEGDLFFEYIDQAKLLEAIRKEIELCKQYCADEMFSLFQAEKEALEKNSLTL